MIEYSDLADGSVAYLKERGLDCGPWIVKYCSEVVILKDGAVFPGHPHLLGPERYVGPDGGDVRKRSCTACPMVQMSYWLGMAQTYKVCEVHYHRKEQA